MSNLMTPTTLAADAAQQGVTDLIARATDAMDDLTPAPWWHDNNEGYSINKVHARHPTDPRCYEIVAEVIGDSAAAEANARFIAFARAWVPEAADALTAMSEQNGALAAQVKELTDRFAREVEQSLAQCRRAEAAEAKVAELTREKQAIALDALAASGQAQEAYEAQLAAEAKVARLEGALVDHNDLLRSAFAIAKREGVEGQIASTNWDAYYNRVAVVLKRHHETVNEARAALTEGTPE